MNIFYMDDGDKNGRRNGKRRRKGRDKRMEIAKSPKELIDFLQSFDYKNYRGYASGYAEYLFYNL